VTLAALKGEETLVQLAERFDVLAAPKTSSAKVPESLSDCREFRQVAAPA
jgi:hypothetical protein